MMTRFILAALRLHAARALRTALTLSADARSRRALRRLDDHLLRDIGLTRAEAEALASEPFRPGSWDAPPHWHQPTYQLQSHAKVQAKAPPKDCAFPACSA
jgi:uncharacterized protein YjiS (DUF1127 family)